MWAKSESLQNAGHQMAGALTPPRRRKPEKNRVLRCQLVLCAVAVLGMLLLQRLRPESAERFKAESRTMLSSPLIGQQQVVRFAMAAAEKLQQAAQIQPQQAQPVQVLAAAGRKTKQPPAGCSLQSPAVQLPLGRPLRQLAVTSGYGWRKAPQKDFHTGTDLAAAQGTPVFPALSGYVRAAGRHPSYGNYLRILHANGVETLYAHMQYLFVAQGELVQQTTCLGTVGQTGNATGPHLHFELLQNDVRYDPAPALPL